MSEKIGELVHVRVNGQHFVGIPSKVQVMAAMDTGTSDRYLTRAHYGKYVEQRFMNTLMNIQINENATVETWALNDEEAMMLKSAEDRMVLAEKFAAKQVVVDYFRKSA